jgi:hypothetical protein
MAKSWIIDGQATSCCYRVRAGAIGDVVFEKRRKRRVAEEQHLAGFRIHLRMRGHRSAQLAGEIVQADGLERPGRHLCRQRGLDQRQQLAGVKDDVGVGRDLEARLLAGRDLQQTREQRLARGALLFETVALHPAIAVRGAAFTQRDGVDHAVAVEPVVAAGRLVRRIGSVAVEGPVQLAWDGPDHLEIVGRSLLAPRREVPLQKWVGIRFACGHERFLLLLSAPARRAGAGVVS